MTRYRNWGRRPLSGSSTWDLGTTGAAHAYTVFLQVCQINCIFFFFWQVRGVRDRLHAGSDSHIPLSNEVGDHQKGHLPPLCPAFFFTAHLLSRFTWYPLDSQECYLRFGSSLPDTREKLTSVNLQYIPEVASIVLEHSVSMRALTDEENMPFYFSDNVNRSTSGIQISLTRWWWELSYVGRNVYMYYILICTVLYTVRSRMWIDYLSYPGTSWSSYRITTFPPACSWSSLGCHFSSRLTSLPGGWPCS